LFKFFKLLFVISLFVQHIGEKLSLGPFDADKADSMELGEVRSSQPVKTFLTSPRKKVSDSKDPSKKVLIAGIKACDLASLKLQDFVFQEGDYKDPFYARKREDLTIISCDCTSVRETCFCMAMGKCGPKRSLSWCIRCKKTPPSMSPSGPGVWVWGRGRWINTNAVPFGSA